MSSYHRVPSVEDIKDEISDVEEVPHAPASTSRSIKAWKAFDITVRYLTYCLVLVLAVKAFLHPTAQYRTGSDNSPPASTVEKVYGVDEDYFSLDHTFDYLWDDDLDPFGTVIFDEWNKEHQVWQKGVISMFHQLHCLSTLQKALQHATNDEEIGTGGLTYLHWPHCFYYLRQSILCAADATIEHGLVRNGTLRYGKADGSKDVRLCKDSKSLYQLRSDRGVMSGHYDAHGKTRVDELP